MPYLALKVIWLTGGHLGAADATTMRDSSMVVLNAVTAAMDLAAIAIALAFTHSWGQRIPGWLLLPPIWVAMGLLVRFVLAVPITTIAGMMTPRGSGEQIPAETTMAIWNARLTLCAAVTRSAVARQAHQREV